MIKICKADNYILYGPEMTSIFYANNYNTNNNWQFIIIINYWLLLIIILINFNV